MSNSVNVFQFIEAAVIL